MRNLGWWGVWGVSMVLAGPALAARGEQVVTCESQDRRLTTCPVDTGAGVELLEQHSKAPCTENQSWGYGPRSIWVSAGCRADFLIYPSRRSGGSVGSGAYAQERGRDGRGRRARPQVLVCESENRRRAFCPVRIRGGVELHVQLSDAVCEEGYSWGYDAQGIWVSRGCRAEFLVD